MKTFFNKAKRLFVAGFLFLLPVFVVFIVVRKAWTALTATGAKIASVFGLQTTTGAAVFTALLLIVICIVCGLLIVRFSSMKRFNQMVEGQLMKYIPGYGTYKALAEEKLQQKEKIIPWSPALLKTGNDSLQPVFIIEIDDAGNNIILIPAIPETNKGQLFIVKEERLERVSTFSANEFDKTLRSMGKGLLSHIRVPVNFA